MNLIKSSLLSFSAFCLVAFTACGNSNAVNKQVKSSAEVTQSSQPEQPAALSVSNSKIQAELEKAKKEGKAVFVVVTGTDVTETDKATTIAKGANAIYKNAAVVQLDRDDAANSELVAEWRLAGAPLPLVLVVSPKGQLSGGMILSQATAENIAALVPSQKLEEVYASIAASKPALVVFTKKTMSDRAEVLKECKEAATKLKNNAVIIEVDMDDSKEVNFMNQLQIDKASTVSTTIVINTQGQVAGTSKSVPDATKLASAATAPVKSGCGPGCGPTGCAK
jgi:hypothetical protein